MKSLKKQVNYLKKDIKYYKKSIRYLKKQIKYLKKNLRRKLKMQIQTEENTKNGTFIVIKKNFLKETFKKLVSLSDFFVPSTWSRKRE